MCNKQQFVIEDCIAPIFLDKKNLLKNKYLAESNFLQYFGNKRHNLGAFAEVVKVTKHTGL